MKASYFISIVFLVLLSCNSHRPEEHLQSLSGYWQIESAVGSSGNNKEFGFNPLVDYIELKGDSGIRKKLAPRLDGSFESTNSADKFFLKMEHDSLRMMYQTPFSKWTETIIQLDTTKLQILNKDGKLFTYKRFEKIEITE